MRRKYTYVLILSLLVFAFLSPVTAHEREFDTDTVEYGSDTQIIIKCHKDHANCDGNAFHGETLQVCGTNFGLNKNTNSFPGAGDPEYIEHVNVVEVPKDVACGLGQHELTLRLHDGRTFSGGYLEVVPAGGMDPHKGDYLYLWAETDGALGVRNFFLSNDVWSSNPKPAAEQGWGDTGWAIVVEDDGGTSGNEEAAYPMGEKVTVDGTEVIKGGIITSDIRSQVACTNNGALDVGSTDPPCKVLEGSVSDGFCSDDPCEVVKTGFSVSENFGFQDWGASTMTPVHNNEDYSIDGEMIVGYDERTGSNNLQFFLCRDGSNHAVDLYPASVDQSEVYTCQTDWEPAPECSDGVDNDNDGDTDYSADTDCDSPSDPTERPEGGHCADAIIGEDASGDKVAFYGENPGGTYTDQITGCSYDYVDENPQGGDPVTFYCFKDDSQNRLWDSERNDFCKSGIPDSDFDEHGSNQMLAIEYYIPLHAIPYGSVYASSVGDYDPDIGFDNDQHQSIHDAEEKYDTGDSLTCDGPCHDKTMWEEERNLTNTDGYASPEDPSAIENAWIESNATGYGTLGIQNTGNRFSDTSGTVDEDHVWDGGFAGNCPAGQKWRYYQNEWRCTGSVNTNQEVFLPEMSQDSSKGGLFILPYYFHDYSPRTLKSYYEASDRTRLETLDAKCWKGGSSSTYSGASSNSKFSLTINNLPQDPSVPVPVVGDMNHDGTFTCSWNYTDSTGSDVSDVGNLVQLGSSQFSSRANASVDLRDMDYNESGQKLVGTVGSSTLNSVANEWKNALGLSY